VHPLVVDVPAGPEVLDALAPALRAALDASAPPVLPVPPPPDPRRDQVLEALRPDRPVEVDGVAVVLATGGSTGPPKGVLLSAVAMGAAALRQDERIGGPGLWVLALPAWHAGGLQVVVRALRGGVPVHPMDLTRPFGAQDFTETTTLARRRADALGLPLLVSLVPTQVTRLVDAGRGEVLAAYDGVLVGAAAAPAGLLDGLRSSGVQVLESYGMSETCGGYAYDGVPIRDVDVTLTDGRVGVAGPTLFSGYRLRPDLTEQVLVGGRLLTPDLGRWEDGRLRLLGRADDVILTGGEKVAAPLVAATLLDAPGVTAAAVVGVPDREWGESVVAFVVPADPDAPPAVEDLRGFVRDRLGPVATPRRVHPVAELPVLASGKLDRAGLAALDASYPGPV